MLHSLLTVLDDEHLVVLHGNERKGYVVSFSGISDNFHLQILLADVLARLPEPDRLHVDPFSDEVISVCTDPSRTKKSVRS